MHIYTVLILALDRSIDYNLILDILVTGTPKTDFTHFLPKEAIPLERTALMQRPPSSGDTLLS